MASSVYYRFKSQKEPSRITFDGTGISIFELKRAIIETSNLGDGTDFELTLTSSDGNEIYDDDTEIIPRSTTVIAKRQPAARPGRGGAARYVSGKAPTASKNTQRMENTLGKGDQNTVRNASVAASAISELQTEKQREEAVLKLGAEIWKHQQKEMASATPVLRSGPKGKPNTSENPPPEWYICNRCGVKGHWIKDCPQNGNPDFDDNRRIKKSIGIPRSRLEIIDKKTLVGEDGNIDSSKLPAGAMIDGDGNYVIVKPDKVTWNKYQEKANKSAAAQEEEARGSRELKQRGLECQIDKRMFVEPTKTPCCQATYCNECITNALLDDDLRCPNCGKEGVLIDHLQLDTDMVARIRSYEDERAGGKQQIEEISNSMVTSAPKDVKDISDNSSITVDQLDHCASIKQSDPKSSPSPRLRKRKAETDLMNNRRSPVEDANSKTLPENANTQRPVSSVAQTSREPPRGPRAMANSGYADASTLLNGNFGLASNPSASMGPVMGMMPFMWDPMTMINTMGVMNAAYNQSGPIPQGSESQSQNQYGSRRGNSHSTPHRVFNATRPNPEENAYFRAPVNPHRHQNRRNIPRPTDYREI